MYAHIYTYTPIHALKVLELPSSRDKMYRPKNLYAYTYTHRLIHAHTYIHTHTYTSIQTYIHTYTHIHGASGPKKSKNFVIFGLCLYMHVYTHKGSYMFIHTQKHTYIRTCIHALTVLELCSSTGTMYRPPKMHMHMHIQTGSYMLVHTQKQTYIHSQFWNFVPLQAKCIGPKHQRFRHFWTMYLYAHVCICAYIETQAHTCSYTHRLIHAHTHTGSYMLIHTQAHTCSYTHI
jgi:hypothetical protein